MNETGEKTLNSNRMHKFVENKRQFNYTHLQLASFTLFQPLSLSYALLLLQPRTYIHWCAAHNAIRVDGVLFERSHHQPSDDFTPSAMCFKLI